MTARRVDSIIREVVLTTLSDPVNRARIVIASDDPSTSKIRDKVEALEGERRHVRDLAQVEGVDDDIRQRLKTLASKIEDQRGRLRRLDRASIVESLPEGDALRDRWDGLALDVRRAAVADVIKSVRVKPSKVRGCVFDARRLVVVPR